MYVIGLVIDIGIEVGKVFYWNYGYCNLLVVVVNWFKL